MNEPPYYVAIAFPVIVAVLIGIAALALRLSPFYARAIAMEEHSTRYHPIDGLRGLLAIGVFLHHGVITYYFYKTGVWTLPPSKLATLFGQGGVAFFFMITAFLFWRRTDIHATGGMRRFFWSRICRLGPMYGIAACSVIAIALALSHFRFTVSPKDFAAQIVSWLAFTLPGTPDINGFKNTNLINGVFWTLIYEWKFYLGLPLLLLFRATTPFIALSALTAALLYLFAPDSPSWYFLSGAVAATLMQVAPRLREVSRSLFGTFIALASLVLVYVTQHGAYNPIAAALLFAPFVIIANGNTLFGFLTWRPVRLLGLISYSVYLLHCTFLYLGFRLVAHTTSVAELTPIAFWAIICGIGAVVVGVSMTTYWCVEHRYAKRPVPTWIPNL